ncbi:hypothetical protein V8E53_011823 [Lactarius tabidus]
MAPFNKYRCPCFKCSSKKDLSKRTIRIHFRENLIHLNNLRDSGTDLSTLAFVENCHYDLMHLLRSLAEESQATRPPGSPYPDVDAPTDLPSLSRGVFRDRDAMMVGDDSDASFLFQGREPTDGMDQSQSDPDDDSDGDDNPIMFDIPEEIMDPVLE